MILTFIPAFAICHAASVPANPAPITRTEGDADKAISQFPGLELNDLGQKILLKFL
jgi:hypothetical protein